MANAFPLHGRRFGVHAGDPSAVFLVKSLLFPVAVVVTLMLSLAFWREPLSGPYFLVAVLGFFGAADLLDVAAVQVSQTWSFALRSLVDIALRWLFVTAFIWVLLRVSGLTE